MTGAELRERRRDLGLSQRKFAARLGVHAVTVSRWESGVYPIPERLVMLAFENIALRRQVEALLNQLELRRDRRALSQRPGR